MRDSGRVGRHGTVGSWAVIAQNPYPTTTREIKVGQRLSLATLT